MWKTLNGLQESNLQSCKQLGYTVALESIQTPIAFYTHCCVVHFIYNGYNLPQKNIHLPIINK